MCSFVVSNHNSFLVIYVQCSLYAMVFTGNTAPYHITQPSTDNYVQIVSPNVTMATLTCSLNVTIPSDAVIAWVHNGSVVAIITPDGSTTRLTIENPQSSDAGDYECILNDAAGSGWVLSRNIILLITGMLVYGPYSNN